MRWVLVWLSTCTLLTKEEREVFVSLDICAAESLNSLLGDLGEPLPLRSPPLWVKGIDNSWKGELREFGRSEGVLTGESGGL